MLSLDDFSLCFYSHDGVYGLWHFGQFSSNNMTIQNYKTGDLIDIAFGLNSAPQIKVKNASGSSSYMTAEAIYSPSVVSGTGKSTNITVGNIKMTFVGGVLVAASNV